MKLYQKAAPALALGGLVVLIACSDPPPPSLAHVGITQVYDNTGKTSITYTYSDIANCQGREGDVTKGITIGDGLTIAMAFTRSIANPPSETKDEQALLTKAFTFAVTGDAFTISKAKEAERVIINTQHPGDGTLVISVDGAGGNFAMPVHVVDQGAVPPNADTTSNCVKVVVDAGSEASTTAEDSGTTDDTDAGVDSGP